MAGIDIIEIGFNQPELWRFKEKNLDQTGKSRGGVHPPFLGMGAHPPFLGMGAHPKEGGMDPPPRLARLVKVFFL